MPSEIDRRFRKFTLTVRPAADGYAIDVTSPAGDVRDVRFGLVRDERFEALIAATRPRAPDMATSRELGGRLFEALFSGRVLGSYRTAEGITHGSGEWLGVVLSCEAPDLDELPWELLYDAERDRFLAAASETPFCRYVPLSTIPSSLTMAPPLRVLLVSASPSGLAPVNSGPPLDRIRDAFAELERSGRAEVRRLDRATRRDLRTALEWRPHLLHVVCHGRPGAGGNVELVLEDEGGDAHGLPAPHLAELLRGSGVRCAALMACHTAARGEDRLGALGPMLEQAGVAAVVTIQQELSQEAAIEFAAFYASLVQSEPIGVAINVARQAMLRARAARADWALPVLHTRDPDERLLARRVSTDDQRTGHSSLNQAFDALAELMAEPAARAVVLAHQGDFEAFEDACEQIGVLADYKALHDALHTLRFHCYDRLANVAKLALVDEAAWDEAPEYNVDFRHLVSEIEEVGGRGKVDPQEELWIRKLGQIRVLLQEAIDSSDVAKLSKAVERLGGVIFQQPTNINERLRTAASAVRLPALVKALGRVHAELARLDLDPVRLRQIRDGVEILAELEAGLTPRVEEHHSLQNLDDELRQFKIDPNFEVDDLEWQWTDLKAVTLRLCGESTATTCVELRDAAEKLDGSLQTRNPREVRKFFRPYFRAVGTRFYVVDHELKDLCEQLRQADEPLATVVRSFAG